MLTCIYFQPCVEIVCYQRCHSSVAAVGNNDVAEWRQDSSMLAVTVCILWSKVCTYYLINKFNIFLIFLAVAVV